MIPAHDSFYDVFSKGKKIKVQWPNGARLAVTLAGNLEAWTEMPDPKLRRTRHVGGSNPITAEEVRCKYDFRTASERLWGKDRILADPQDTEKARAEGFLQHQRPGRNQIPRGGAGAPCRRA